MTEELKHAIEVLIGINRITLSGGVGFVLEKQDRK
jgi:hypothetical protein